MSLHEGMFLYWISIANENSNLFDIYHLEAPEEGDRWHPAEQETNGEGMPVTGGSRLIQIWIIPILA